jgi:hypothetical protein
VEEASSIDCNSGTLKKVLAGSSCCKISSEDILSVELKSATTRETRFFDFVTAKKIKDRSAGLLYDSIRDRSRTQRDDLVELTVRSIPDRTSRIYLPFQSIVASK